jgi:hypothetical protein
VTYTLFFYKHIDLKYEAQLCLANFHFQGQNMLRICLNYNRNYLLNAQFDVFFGKITGVFKKLFLENV